VIISCKFQRNPFSRPIYAKWKKYRWRGSYSRTDSGSDMTKTCLCCSICCGGVKNRSVWWNIERHTVGGYTIQLFLSERLFVMITNGERQSTSISRHSISRSTVLIARQSASKWRGRKRKQRFRRSAIFSRRRQRSAVASPRFCTPSKERANETNCTL